MPSEHSLYNFLDETEESKGGKAALFIMAKLGDIMRANFLSVMQKTLCIAPLFFTFAFSPNLVVLASQQTIEITIQANDYGIVLHTSTMRFVIGNPVYTINGQLRTSDTIPFIDPVYNRAMIPLNIVSEALGLGVSAETNLTGENQVITLTRSNTNLLLETGKPLANDKGRLLVVDGHVFVPITYLAQRFEADIRWDRNTQAIYVTDSFESPMLLEIRQPEAHKPEIQQPKDSQQYEELQPAKSPQLEEITQVTELPQVEESIQLTKPVQLSEPTIPTVVHAVYISELEHRLLELTNVERVRHGLNPLVWNDGLARAASRHSRDMARNDFVSHTGSDGAGPGARAIQEGVTGMVYVAENIAAGTRTPERTIEAWMSSEKHRNNILNTRFRYFGASIYSLEGSQWGVYTTQKFGR